MTTDLLGISTSEPIATVTTCNGARGCVYTALVQVG